MSVVNLSYKKVHEEFIRNGLTNLSEEIIKTCESLAKTRKGQEVVQDFLNTIESKLRVLEAQDKIYKEVSKLKVRDLFGNSKITIYCELKDIITIQHLLDFNHKYSCAGKEDGLRNIKGFGLTTLNKIKSTLLQYGVNIREERK